MRIDIRVKQAPDHALVLSLMLGRFELKKFDALLTQSQSDLYALLAKRQLSRWRQEVWNDLNLAQRLICVGYLLSHRQPFLCANTRRR